LNQQAKLRVNDSFYGLLSDTNRYEVLYGGSGSGKSVFATQKIVIRTVGEEKHRFLCIRKVANTLRSSVYQILIDCISDLGLRSEIEINKTEMRFTHTSTGNEILLAGLDDVERLKSIAGITSIWVEEATELTEGDFDQIDLRLRGETANYKQIILSFNPHLINYTASNLYIFYPDNISINHINRSVSVNTPVRSFKVNVVIY